jgi:hypothetical protein
MKKMLYGLLLRTVLGTSPAEAAQPRTTFYIVALTGAALHAQPSFTSKLVRRLPLGGVVQAQQTIASKDVQRIGAGLALPGDWIKVTTPTYTGYVFSADLTTKRPVLKKSRSGLAYIDLLGAKKGSPRGKQLLASSPGKRSVDETRAEVTEYANGTYTMTASDGCFTHAYAFRHLALHEVYHQLISAYAGYEGTQLRQPKLLGKKGNVYTFTCGFGDTDAAQQLQLTIHSDGTFSMSSYDCT